MSNATENFDDFWAWCAQNGVVSKKLLIQRNVLGLTSELSLHAGEPIRAGAVVATVPYPATLNAQTVRGDMRPVAVPPVRTMCAFLTRRGRMDVLTARSLWLASCLACYWRLLSQGHELCIAPLLSRKILPPLPSPFKTANVKSYPAIAAAVPDKSNDTAKKAFLSTLKETMEAQLQVTHTVLHFHQRRRAMHVFPHLVPTLDELRMAYCTVLHRSVLLPVDCVPSSPGDLADLLLERPELDLLPSLVPIIDMIRSPSAARSSIDSSANACGDAAAAANCLLHTCIHADFVSPETRRRVVLETAPFSNCRVVVCAASELKEGDELLLDFESG